MASAKTYIISFKLALANELAYRMNFLFGVVRHFISYVSVMFVFAAMPHGIGLYTQPQAMSYILVSAFVSSIILTSASKTMLDEVSNGFLANFLVKPVHYFLYWGMRLAATRLLLLIAGVVQVVALMWLFGNSFAFSLHARTVVQGVTLLVGGVLLVQLIDFALVTAGFWAYRTHALSWFMTIVVQFLSGAFLPIDALPSAVRGFFLATPFPSIVYSPTRAFLGTMSIDDFLYAIAVQMMWCIAVTLLLVVLWRRGVKSYECIGR